MASSEEKNDCLVENSIQFVRGLPLGSWFKKETIEEILDFMPSDGDVIIATYPKTGTTWMQYIVHQILTNGESLPEFNELLEKVIPFLEMSGVSAVEAITIRPRVYKHHLPYNMMKKNPNTKVIYVYRKPEDTFVSYYHFLNNMNLLVNDFDQYFEDFLTGNISYGRYFEHILSYLEHEKDGNILFVSYEKLQIHRKREILRIAKFLGEEYFKNIINDESIINKIIEQTSFDYMKQNLTVTMPKDVHLAFEREKSEEEIPTVKVNFFRKGIIGDGKNSLKDVQLSRLYELTKEKMKDTFILSEWLEE